MEILKKTFSFIKSLDSMQHVRVLNVAKEGNEAQMDIRLEKGSLTQAIDLLTGIRIRQIGKDPNLNFKVYAGKKLAADKQLVQNWLSVKPMQRFTITNTGSRAIDLRLSVQF